MDGSRLSKLSLSNSYYLSQIDLIIHYDAELLAMHFRLRDLYTYLDRKMRRLFDCFGASSLSRILAIF